MITDLYFYGRYIGIALLVLLGICISIAIIQYRISAIKQQMTDMRIRELIHRREEALRHQLLLAQITQQNNKPRTMDELQHVFGKKTASLRECYPLLTDLDVQVLILIGLGVENSEILRFTDMSKRTYYKRRQLIAQRMGTTAAQLDQTAKQIFTPNF